MGSGIGTILASIGIPLVVDLIKKMTGRSAPRFGRSPLQGKQDGHGAPRLGMYEPPPPFIGTWEQMHGGRKKKNSNGPRSAIKQKFTIQKHTSVKPHTVKPKFHKNIPTSNRDLTKWSKYLNIPGYKRCAVERSDSSS